MPLVTHFCGVCGCRVPPEDLEQGRAVILKHVTYCTGCASKAGIAPGPERPAAPTVLERSAAGRGGPGRARRRASPRAARRPHPSAAGPLIGGVIALVSILLVVAVVAIATRGDDEPGPGVPRAQAPDPPVRPRGAEPDAARVARERARERAQEAYRDLRRFDPPASASLGDLAAAASDAKRAQTRLRERSAPPGGSDPEIQALLARGEAHVRDLEERVDAGARSVYGERMEAIDAFVATGNFDRALQLVVDLPPELGATRWGKKLTDQTRRIETARGEHARVQATRRDPGWTYLFTAASLDGWTRKGNASWQLAEDPVGYRFLEVRNPGPGKATLGFALTGSAGWERYQVRVDLRRVEGELVVYVRGPGAPGGATGIRVPETLLPSTKDWWTLRVDADGDLYRLFLGTRIVKELRNSAGPAGCVGFGLTAKGRVEIRNVRVKHGR